MRVLLIGSNGNMGKRYSAILDYTRIPYDPVDVTTGRFLRSFLYDIDSEDLCLLELFMNIKKAFNNNDYTHVIICTKTDTHIPILKILAEKKHLKILCEKPLEVIKYDQQLKRLKEEKSLFEHGNIYVVNNWYHIYFDHLKDMESDQFEASQYPIKYDYYHTGKDGLAWDCWQLFGLNSKSQIILDNKSPIWNVEISGEEVSKDHVDKSYMHMLDSFLNNKTGDLWDLEKAIEVTERCYAYSIENSDRDTST